MDSKLRLECQTSMTKVPDARAWLPRSFNQEQHFTVPSSARKEQNRSLAVSTDFELWQNGPRGLHSLANASSALLGAPVDVSCPGPTVWTAQHFVSPAETIAPSFPKLDSLNVIPSSDEQTSGYHGRSLPHATRPAAAGAEIDAHSASPSGSGAESSDDRASVRRGTWNYNDAPAASSITTDIDASEFAAVETAGANQHTDARHGSRQYEWHNVHPTVAGVTCDASYAPSVRSRQIRQRTSEQASPTFRFDVQPELPRPKRHFDFAGTYDDSPAAPGPWGSMVSHMQEPVCKTMSTLGEMVETVCESPPTGSSWSSLPWETTVEDHLRNQRHLNRIHSTHLHSSRQMPRPSHVQRQDVAPEPPTIISSERERQVPPAATPNLTQERPAESAPRTAVLSPPSTTHPPKAAALSSVKQSSAKKSDKKVPAGNSTSTERRTPELRSSGSGNPTLQLNPDVQLASQQHQDLAAVAIGDSSMVAWMQRCAGSQVSWTMRVQHLVNRCEWIFSLVLLCSCVTTRREHALGCCGQN